jgi:hypothetical protein
MTETTMTPERVTALRQPFPEESVGKLPKSTCRECSNAQNKRCERHPWVYGCPDCKGNHSTATVHLDYVGHAAVTDRLLTVDPLWSWEPMALGPDGLPALDRAGNLWIRLTIHGASRLGVGDGRNAKEQIGDAIRNAAMRFGVALDLWTKDDLVEFKVAAEQGRITVDQSVPNFTPPAEPAVRGVTKPQLAKINVELRRLRITDSRVALAFYKDVVGREVAATKDLTEDEAVKVLNALAVETTPTDDDGAVASGEIPLSTVDETTAAPRRLPSKGAKS